MNCLVVLLLGHFVPLASASCGAGVCHTPGRQGPHAASASMVAAPASVPCEGGWVNVTWASIDFATSHDWIGMYAVPSKEDVNEPLPWPIKYKRVENTTNQTTRFWIIDRRVKYVFYYISGTAQYPELKVLSNVVEVSCNNAPVRPHLAYAPEGGMYVMWQQASDPGGSTVQWQPIGSGACGQNGSAPAVARTFRREDLCDKSLFPAARGGWMAPGFVLWALIPGSALCSSGRFEVTVGDSSSGFTKPLQFTAPPKVGPNEPVRMVAFGDMGSTSYGMDDALEFSWDFQDRGEIPTLNTTRQIERLHKSDGVDFVLHFGDISYAVGFLAKWDQWLDLIQPVTNGLGLPWMASMGNHEYGWSKSDWTDGRILRTDTDSGGECGMPFITHFPYAQQTVAEPQTTSDAGFGPPPTAGVCAGGECDSWYSFKYGSIHFTMIDTEHNLSAGSKQWNWLKEDLASVDRSVTPWLVVTGHRPLEDALDWQPGQQIAAYIKAILDPLLHEFGVDLFWSGHSHNYQRHAPKDADAYVNLVIGSAGYYNSHVKKDWPGLEMYNDDKYGFTHWEFENATHAHGRYFSNENELLDDFWVKRAFPRAGKNVDILSI